MKIVVTESYKESCKYVAGEIVKIVNDNPSAKLGLATGGTAENVYPFLVEAYEKGEADFSKITTVNLDEYLGMKPDNPVSYRKCMDTWFFDKVKIINRYLILMDSLVIVIRVLFQSADFRNHLKGDVS